MNKKNQEPKPNFGFYAVVPRIVRTQYKKLSHAEKWLYVCLKDLCGDKGTCFRTLRALSEETDVSTGSLSKMIPNLHKHGLIHAEKKRRTESGKEVWHITIADVWAENAKACSKNEQSTSEVVQIPNNDVQKMNDNPKDGSKNERDCSNFVDRRKNTEEVTIIEERTREESKNDESQQNSNALTQEGSFIHPSTSISSLSEEVTKTYNLICQELYPNCPPDLTTKAIEHFTKLSKDIKTVEDIKSLVAYCRQEQPVLNTSKIHPGNLVRWLDGWLQSRPSASTVFKGTPLLDTMKAAQRQAEESRLQEEQAVSDEELAEEVLKKARFYQDEANFEAHLKFIERFKKEFKLNNFDMCDKIALASRRANPDKSDIQDFLYQLRCTVM